VCAVNLTVTSDGRFKKNIQENVPGLEFINQLRPITYNLDITGLNKFRRPNGATANSANQGSTAISGAEQVVQTGFIAQEVETAAKKLNYDFNGVDAPKSQTGVYGLRYSQFVVPLVKAVQQLSSSYDSLKAKNDSLTNVIGSLQSQLNTIQQQINEWKTAGGIGMSNSTIAVLKQNAPNPFNGSTIIPYYIPPTAGSAQLLISDMSGHNLQTIAINGKGAGQVFIDAGTLASGNYAYTLQVDGKTIATRKMVLVK
jgi:hypothetical protein